MKQTLNSHPEEEPNREIAALMESERPHLLRYACYRLGNADDAEDAVQDIFLQLHTKTLIPQHYNLTLFISS